MVNANLGFELMKIARVGGSLSMTRAHANGGCDALTGSKSRQNA
jgi:hypothetical protein